jgi:cation transport protein ChaC
VVFRLPEAGREEILDALWRREMSGGVYVPTWAEADTDVGKVWALGFVANRGHQNYAGQLPVEISARIIATALGTRGTCHEYLSLLVDALEDHGIEDHETFDLHQRVQRELKAVT